MLTLRPRKNALIWITEDHRFSFVRAGQASSWTVRAWHDADEQLLAQWGIIDPTEESHATFRTIREAQLALRSICPDPPSERLTTQDRYYIKGTPHAFVLRKKCKGWSIYVANNTEMWDALHASTLKQQVFRTRRQALDALEAWLTAHDY